MGIQNFFLNDFSCDEKSMKQGVKLLLKNGCMFSDISIKEVELLMEVRKLIGTINYPVQNAYHQNIIQLLGILIDNDSRCIGYIMPYMPNGSLGDVIHNKSQNYDEQQIKSWITQICYGLSYLHDRKIIHRDIKPSNVLLGKSRDDVRLSDFGVARSLENIKSTLTKGLGTLLYMAPEMFKDEKYNFAVDVYSLSITIWEILYRRIPYDHTKCTNRWILYDKISKGERTQLNNNSSKEESDLLMRCWDADVSKRPTVDHVREFYSKTTLSLSTSAAESSPEKQTILLLGRKNNDSLLMLENNEQNWKQLNIKLPYAIHGHGAQFVNNNLYIFGGGKSWNEYLNCTYKLSKSLQWEKMADMNQTRSRISNSSVILNNQIWVCGGHDGERDYLKSVEMYDPETNEWKYMKEMNESRQYAAASVVNGKIFCSGGYNEKNSLNSVECYDPFSDIWTRVCEMPQNITEHAAVEIDGYFIVMGGWVQNSVKTLNNVWALDTTNESAEWIEKPSMIFPRRGLSIAKIDNKIFVCGGKTNGDVIYVKFIDGKHVTTDDMEIFDGEVWRSGPKIPTDGIHAPAVVISMEFARELKQFSDTVITEDSSRCSVQ